VHQKDVRDALALRSMQPGWVKLRQEAGAFSARLNFLTGWALQIAVKALHAPAGLSDGAGVPHSHSALYMKG
jgi:hypothetical protein